jgi:hypothetical protein
LELPSGYSGAAYREYYYLLEHDHIHVTFADAPPGERTFLRLRPRPLGGQRRRDHVVPAPPEAQFPGAPNGCPGSQAQDTHHCGRDTYTGTYNFESAGRLVVTMDVHGPEKNYVIHTELTRRPPASSPPQQHADRMV